MPKFFFEFNQIDKINLSNQKEIDSLIFKMAAFEIINETKAYRSIHCAHDLYFTGYNMSEIPEGKDQKNKEAK